jgi:Ca-activated chloride channel family protein
MTFQFLRPEWLLLLIPLFALLWLLWNRSGSGRDWESVVDPALLPHLLVGKKGRSKRWPLLVFFIAGLLAITALSGPVWKKLPLPVFKQQSALVIALDLSTSMDAADIKPSRLTRARLKLKDLLSRRTVGQTALIAYAATPYTVTPLTDDTDTIQSLVSSLTTELMPAQGSRADLAIAKAVELFKNAGLDKGDILLITDAVNENSQRRIDAMDVSGYRVSVLAVGSAEGAPVPVPGSGYVTDSNGSIVIAKTNFGEMRALASNLGGLYSPLTINDTDLRLFDTLLAEHDVMSQHQKTEFKADRWQEEGPWLLLLVVPLAALVFRRGLILVLVLMVVTVPEPALAQGWQWDQLWKNRDQRAQEALQQGAVEEAAELFEQNDWKAAALYKSQQYGKALEQLESSKSGDALYNRGNILAKMGRLEEALESYDEVLQKHPQHEDAQYNREQVKKALEQQQQQQQGQQDKDSQKDQSEQSSNEQNQQSEQSESESESDQRKQDSEQSSGEQQSTDSESSEDEQQNQTEQQQQQKEEAERELAEQKKKQQEDAEDQHDKESQTEAQAQMDMSEKLSEQAERQWLRRIPDDPGGLLRNKFKYQYSRQPQANREQEEW